MDHSCGRGGASGAHQTRDRQNRIELALPLAVLLLSGPVFAAQSAERLVPANFNPRMDAHGCRWDIQNHGGVGNGTNHCFSSAALLQVRGNNFNASQPMMTADGKEFVLTRSNWYGLNVTRRVKVDTKLGLARFLDIFHNPGTAPISTSATLHYNMNNQCQAFLTDKGTPTIGLLGKKESGIVAIHRPGNNRPSGLFLLASPSSKLRPSIQVHNNHYMNIVYPLNVPAGKTVSILHGVAQRHLSGIPDAKTLAKLFKPFRSRALIRDIPSSLRKTIINVRGLGAGGGAASLLSLEELGVERGAADILAIGEETRLRGKAACGQLTIRTPHGSAEVPFEKVAALVGGRHFGGDGQIFLRDGQVLRGKVQAQGLRFTMSSGLALDLHVETLDRLALRVSPEDGQPGDDVKAFLETVTGNRLSVLAGLGQNLALRTPWGKMAFSIADLRSLQPMEEQQPGHVVRLHDGTRCCGFLEAETIELETRLFGKQKVNPADFRSISFAKSGKAAEEDDEPEITQPHIVLVGENTLIGRIDLPEVRFLALGETIPVAPTQIRTLHNDDEGEDGTGTGPQFTAELWGGGMLSGQLRHGVLPVRVSDRVYLVPARDIVDVVVPSPTVSDTLRNKVAQLIRELGHPEWEKREAASQQLVELGYLCKQQLGEAHRQTGDPEIRRRTRALLDGID